MRGCLVFGICPVSSCLLCLILVFILFFIFFETDAVHGLPQIALCVYSRGRVGFFGVGWVFVALKKKIWVCCHVQVYVQLYDALIFISMPA